MRTKGTEEKKKPTDASDSITARKTDEKAAHYSSVASDSTQSPKEREAAMLFSVAEEHVDDDEDYEEALKAAEEALKIFHELGNSKGAADTLRLIFHALIGKSENARWTEKGDPATNLVGQVLQQAEERAQEELGKFKEAGSKIGEASMRLSLAELASHERGPAKREEALESSKQARELFQEVGDKKLEADSTALLATIHIWKWDVEEAVKYCQEALEIYRELSDRKEEGKTSHLLACALGLSDQFTASMDAAKESLKIFRELDAKKFLAFELFCMASWNAKRDRGKEAVPQAKEALALFREMGYGKGWQAGAEDMVVQAQLTKGDKKQAFKIAKEGVERLEGSDDKRSQIVARTALVKAHISKFGLADALLETEMALETARELDDKRLQATCLNSLSYVQMNNKAWDQAATAAQEAQQLLQEVGDKSEEAFLLNTLSMVHQEQHDFKMVAQVAGEQRDLYHDLGEKDMEAMSLITLAQALASDGKQDEGLATATEAQAMLQERNNKRGEGSAWSTISAIHDSNGMHDLALQAAQKMQTLYEECDDKRLQASGLREIAQLHMARDEPEEALQIANRARALSKKTENRGFDVEMLVLVTQCQMGVLTEDLSKKQPSRSVLEKAMKAPKEAVIIAKKTGEKGVIALAQHTLGQMYLTQGRIPDALRAADEAAKNFKAGLDTAGEIQCTLLSATALYHASEFAKAMDLCNKALAAAQASGDPEVEHRAAVLLQQMQEKQGGGQQQQQQYQQIEENSPDQQFQSQSAMVPQKKVGLDPKVVEKMVKDTLMASIGTDDDVDMDTPLMEAGMDSLSMVAFRNQLQRDSGIAMPASVMFDYPSMSGLVDHLVEMSQS